MNARVDFSRIADWERDPKHVGFVLSRYKFVARMLEGKERVLEVGAADAMASRVVRQAVGSLTCIDRQQGADVIEHNILESPFGGNFHGVYALDVIEHIQPEDTEQFILNMRSSLVHRGVCIVGSPSRESQIYASELSWAHHVNCMTAKELREHMNRFFCQVFMFGMNDEVLHCGHEGMRHYNIAVGVK